jgi:DNA-binding XRE family transcriptional regulator
LLQTEQPAYIQRMVTSVVVWTLGDRLAKSRRVAGVSRDEMAEYLGFSPQAVSNLRG